MLTEINKYLYFILAISYSFSFTWCTEINNTLDKLNNNNNKIHLIMINYILITFQNKYYWKLN